MDTFRSVDRRIARTLGRWLWRWQERLGLDAHACAFALVGLAYTLVWRWLCLFDHHPEWMWYLLGPGLGAVASYVADHDPVALIDRHVALTRVGAEDRWSVLRLLYPLLAGLLWVQVALSGQHSAAFCGLLAVEMGLFALLEYLLAIRLVVDDQPYLEAAQRLGSMLAAAMAQAQAQQQADEAAPEQPTPPEDSPAPPPAPPPRCPPAC